MRAPREALTERLKLRAPFPTEMWIGGVGRQASTNYGGLVPEDRQRLIGRIMMRCLRQHQSPHHREQLGGRDRMEKRRRAAAMAASTATARHPILELTLSAAPGRQGNCRCRTAVRGSVVACCVAPRRR